MSYIIQHLFSPKITHQIPSEKLVSLVNMAYLGVMAFLYKAIKPKPGITNYQGSIFAEKNRELFRSKRQVLSAYFTKVLTEDSWTETTDHKTRYQTIYYTLFHWY